MARRKKPQRRGPSSKAASPSSNAKRSPSKGGKKPLLSRWLNVPSELLDPTLLGLWLLILLPPFIFLPGLTDNFRLPKLLLSELLGLLSLALLSFRLWRQDFDMTRFWRAPVWRIVLPLLFAGSLGFFFGEHPEVTVRALPSFWIGCLCLIGWSLALRQKERRVLLHAVLWPAGFLALLALLQFHHLFDPFSFQDRVTDRTGLTSLAGGAFDLSGYLVLPLLLAQAALAGASGKRRWWLLFFLLIGTWATIASRTLTVLIALVLGSFLIWRRAVPQRRLLGAAGVVAALTLLLAVFGPLKERAGKLTKSLQKGEVNRLLTGRLDAWRGALWMLEQRPVLGVGHGAFRAEYGPARFELTQRGVTFFRGQKQVFFTNAHSDALNAAAEWGGLGVLAMLFSGAVFVLVLKRRWSSPSRAPPEADDAEPAEAGSEESAAESKRRIAERDLELAALAALVVLCSTYFPFHLGLLAYPWLLFLSGLMAAPKTRTAAETVAPRPLKIRRVVMFALVLGFLSVAWLRFGEARDLLGASRLVAVAEQSILQTAQGGQVPPALLRRNLELLRRAGEMDPAEVGVPIAEGGHFFLLERHDAALRAYERAAKLEERAEIYANIGRVHLAAGRRAEAIEAIEYAVTLDHTQHRAFGDILLEEKRRRRAAGETRP